MKACRLALRSEFHPIRGLLQDCAQVHRHLGRHVSQVKAINTGTYLWFPHEIAVMRQIGNSRAARAYVDAPPKLSASASPAEKLARARDRYESRCWPPRYTCCDEAHPPAPPQQSAASKKAVSKTCSPMVVERDQRYDQQGPQQQSDLITLSGPEPPLDPEPFNLAYDSKKRAVLSLFEASSTGHGAQSASWQPGASTQQASHSNTFFAQFGLV